MTQFSLEKWLQDKNRKVVTRDGKEVKIVCWNVKGLFPILALLEGDGKEDLKKGEEYPCSYKIDGTCPATESYDLFFADEEEELSEFEKAVEMIMDDNAKNIVGVKYQAKCLLELARNEIEKTNPYNGKQNQEWSEEDMKFINSLGVCINELKEKFGWNYVYIGENDIPMNDIVNWLKSLKDRVLPQPQQEWNEEDKTAIERLIDSIEILRSIGHGKPKAIYTDEILDRLILWLKSLKPQPKYQWTDEDEKNLKDLLTYGETKLGLRRWIAGLPEKLGSRSEYHWKPSEEQMQALETAIRCRTMPWEQLGTLYNNLKKL